MQVELNNETKKLAVIGDPVGHSLSPLLQNTMIQAQTLNYIYMAQPVSKERLPQFVEAAKTLNYAGFNATMPHKEALLPLMDGGIDPEAQEYGSINTVAIQGGVCKGYNTDGRGLIRALQDESFLPKGKRIVILGAGGASKAVALSLAREQAAQITICNRSLAKAQALCEKHPRQMMPAPFDTETLRHVVTDCDLLVNCTSMGMHGTEGQFTDLSFLDSMPGTALVYDLIYSPRETLLLSEAKKRGLKIANGLGMLIYQAVFALEIFTNTKLDSGSMRELLTKVL